ncbi:MAG: ABC transporter permease [Solirubrobacteraceae bacterium]
MSVATDIPRAQRSAKWSRIVRQQAWTVGVVAVLVILLIVQANVAPTFTSFDIQSLVIAALPLAFAAMAQSVVVISRGIDLSVGGAMALTNVIAASLMKSTNSLGGALAICALILLIGIVIGTINGLTVVLSGVPDIIATLALGFVWAGAALVVMSTPGGGSPMSFQNLSTGSSLWQWIPNGVLILAGVFLLVWVPLRSRRLGLRLFAVGSDPAAAALSGVPVARTRVLAYTLGGVFAAFGGLALTSTTGIGSPLSGDFYTLTSVAAVVIGGVSLAGGRGGLLAPIIAAFILSTAVTVLTFLGVDSNYGQVIQGALIVVMVMLGGLLLNRRRTA